MGLVMSVKIKNKKKKLEPRGQKQRKVQQCWGSVRLLAQQLAHNECHVPAIQHLKPSCRSLILQQAQNIKVQTSHLVNTA